MTMPANSHPAAIHRPPAWLATWSLKTFNPSANPFRACRTAAVISSGVAAGRAPVTAAGALVVAVVNLAAWSATSWAADRVGA